MAADFVEPPLEIESPEVEQPMSKTVTEEVKSTIAP